MRGFNFIREAKWRAKKKNKKQKNADSKYQNAKVIKILIIK